MKIVRRSKVFYEKGCEGVGGVVWYGGDYVVAIAVFLVLVNETTFFFLLSLMDRMGQVT